eukprot:c18455_g1_i5.p1 GENE.c18455_g1_i5~~c18455_g1_i5.p1  ORF type:complete len:623 (+),score=118.43 c18455_g1_i5:439-2307(+)
MGHTFGVELRAYYNARLRNSLDTWGPVINLNRDPRWGRNAESYGEDPYAIGMLAAAYTKGTQGPNENLILAAVTLKHWLAYSLERYPVPPFYWNRDNFSASVSPFDMTSTYVRLWEVAIKQSNPKGVMCSYNRVNGSPACGTPALTALLRDKLGFDGYITSDTDAIKDIYNSHHTEPSPELAVRDALLAGCDINSGDTYATYLESTVTRGLVDEQYVKNALRRSYRIRFLLGLFDTTPNPYNTIPTSVVGSTAFREQSLNAARQSLVLLKNDDSTLPIPPGHTIALIGQMINDRSFLHGPYTAKVCFDGSFSCVATVAETLQALNQGGHVILVSDITNDTAVVSVLSQADSVVFLADNINDGGKEGMDRLSIRLSAPQLRCANLIAQTSKPKIALVVSGGIIALDDWAPAFDAILQAFIPGIFGAQAIAETLFGYNNPNGKLPVTHHRATYVDEVDFLDMSMTAGSGRSYKFYNGTPVFPFGFGLSYTQFTLACRSSCSPPRVVDLSSDPSPLRFSLQLNNVGTRRGSEVIFAFVVAVSPALPALRGAPIPKKQLVAFQKISVEAGSAQGVEFELALSDFSLVRIDGVRVLVGGLYHAVFSRGHGDEIAIPIQLLGDTIIVD